jgi:hypothetical protein
MVHAFPKIFSLGQPYIKDIFNGEVEITEKIDGSQFVFGKINGELYMRSKGQQIIPENPQRMFREGVDYIVSIQDKLEDNQIHYCEYLQKPKHNVLAYDRIPKNHLALFATWCAKKQSFYNSHDLLGRFAIKLGIDRVKCFFKGVLSDINSYIDEFLTRDSFLGGAKIEGFVVKNYHQPFLLGGQPIPIMAGKYVSEAFKEKHKGEWKGSYTNQGRWEKFKECFRTEPRWHKAIQHLRDSGLLTESPKDIGNLIKEIQKDITDEEQDNIKNFLWNYYGDELLRNAVKGFPEFYKRYLVENTHANFTH